VNPVKAVLVTYRFDEIVELIYVSVSIYQLNA